MKISVSDMSDSEYNMKALNWREKNKAELNRMESEFKKQEKEFKKKEEKSWWKRVFKL
tara:strand:- start:462 stop:635 length:174 start_codon:yes stop_codon:yes gene_type:complete